MLFLQRYVHIVLDAVLGNYVKNIDPEALKISVWNGKIEVDVVELQPDAFPLPPEFRIVKGTLHQVQIDLPWANLASHPIRVDVQNVNLLLEVCDRSPEATTMNASEEDVRKTDPKRRSETLKRKRATLDAIEKATQFNKAKPVAAADKPTRWTQTLMFKLLVKVLDNVQLNVQNIHLRVEDRVSSPEQPFALGVTLASMVIKSADAGWNYTTLVRGTGATPRSGGSDEPTAASFLRKKVDINKFGLYWSLPLSPVPASALEDSFEFMKLMQMNFWSGDLAAWTENDARYARLFQPKDFLIEPLTLSIKLTVNDGRHKLPITHAELCTRVMARLGTPWMVQTITAIGDDAWQEFVNGMPKLTGDRMYTLSFVFAEAWAVAREHNEEEDVVPSAEQFRDALSSCLQWSLAEVDRLQGSISKYRDAVIHVLQEKSTYIDASASIDHINVVIQRQQYLSALNLVSFLAVKRNQARYAHLRPVGVRPADNPRRWWNYAISAVLLDVRERLARVDVEEIQRMKSKRNRYKALYLLSTHAGKKASAALPLVGLVPTDVLQLSRDAAQKELEDLEIELDTKELFYLRSSARQSLSEHASKPSPVAPPSEKLLPSSQTPAPVVDGAAAPPMSSKLWAYTSWLYGGGGGSENGSAEAKTAPPVDDEMQWSDQDTKTLFAAIDFDPDSEGGDEAEGIMLAKRSEKQGQHIWYRCHFLLARTSLRLVGDDTSEGTRTPLLAAVALDNVDFKVLVRPKSIEVGIKLGDANVVGFADIPSDNPRLAVQRMRVEEIITHHPKSVSDNMSCVRLRQCERGLPLIDISIELKSSKRHASLGIEDSSTDGTSIAHGITVSVVAQAIKCDFDVGALLQVTSFFARPSHVDLSGLRERAWRQAQSLQRYSAAQVHAALARRSKVELLVDIISPLITVRESSGECEDVPRSRAQLVVFLGHLRASSRRGSDIMQGDEEGVSLLSSAKPQDHLYDQIDVGVSAIEVRLLDGAVPSAPPSQLLEKTSVRIGVFVSIAANDPTVPLIKVVGGVESVGVNLDAVSFSLLVQLLRSISEDLSRGRALQDEELDPKGGDANAADEDAGEERGGTSVEASRAISHDEEAFFSGFESETRFYSQPSQRMLNRGASTLASSPAGDALYGVFARMRESERELHGQKEIDDKDLLKLWQRILFLVRFEIREVAISLKLASTSTEPCNIVRVGMTNIETELDVRSFDKKLRFALGSFSVEEQRERLGGRFLIASGDSIDGADGEGNPLKVERLIRVAISSVDLEAPKPKDTSLWAQLCDSVHDDGQTNREDASVLQDPLLTQLSVDARLQTLVLNLHQDAFADLFVFFYQAPTQQGDNGSQESSQPPTNVRSAGAGTGRPPIVRKVAKSPEGTERTAHVSRSTTRTPVNPQGLTSKLGTWVAASLAEKMSVRHLRLEPSVSSPVASVVAAETTNSPAAIQLRLQVAGLSVVLHNSHPETTASASDSSVFIRLVAKDFDCCVHRFPEYLGVYAHLMSMRVSDETVPDPLLQEILGSEKRRAHSNASDVDTVSSPVQVPTIDDVLQAVNKIPAIFACAAQIYGADCIQEKWHPGYANRFTVRLNSPRIRVLYRFLDDLRSYFVDGVLLQTVMRKLFPHQVQVAWDEDFLVSSFSSNQHNSSSTTNGASPRPPAVNAAASDVVSTFPLIDIRLVDAKLRIPVHRTSSEALVVRFDAFRLSNEYLLDMFRGMNNRVMAKVLLNASLCQLKMDLEALRVVSTILVDPSFDAQRPPAHQLSGHPGYLRPELLTQSLLGSTSMTLSADFSSGNATTVGIEFSPLRLVCNREQYAFLFRLPIQNFGEARLRTSTKGRIEDETEPQATSPPVSPHLSQQDADVLSEEVDEDEEDERELIVTVKVPQFALEILHGQDGYQPSTSGDMSMAEAEKRASGSICSVDVNEFNASVHYGMTTRSVRVSSELMSMRIRDTRHDTLISPSYRDVVVFEPPSIAGVQSSSISIRVLHGSDTLQEEREVECSFASPHHRKQQVKTGDQDSEQQQRGAQDSYRQQRGRRLRKLSSSFFGSETLVGIHSGPRRASSFSSAGSFPQSKSVASEVDSDDSGSSFGKRRRRSSVGTPSASMRTDITVDVEGFRVIPSNIHYDVLRFLESPGRTSWSTESSPSQRESTEAEDVDDLEGTSNDASGALPSQSLEPQQHYIVLALTLGKSAVLLVEDPSKALSRAVMFSWEATITVEFLRRPTQAPTSGESTPNHRLQVRVDLSNIQATSRLAQNNLWTRGSEPTAPMPNQSHDIAGDFLKPCGLECRLDVDFATGFVRLKAAFDRVLDLRFGYLDVCSLRGALHKIVSFSSAPIDDAPNSSSASVGLSGRRFSVGSSITSSSSAVNPDVDGFTMPSTAAAFSEDGDARQSSHHRKPRDRSVEPSLQYGKTTVYLVSATFRAPLNVRPAIGLYSSPWRKRYLVLPYTAQDRQSVQPTLFRIIPATGSHRSIGDSVRFGDRIALQAVQPKESPPAKEGDENSAEDIGEKNDETVTTISKYDQLGASGYLGPDGSAGIFETRIWKYGTSAFNSDRSVIRHKDAIVLEELTIYRAFSKQSKSSYSGSRLVGAQFDLMDNGETARASGDGGGYLMFNGVGDAPIPFVVSVNTAVASKSASTPRSARARGDKASTPKSQTRPQSATTSGGIALWQKLKVFQFHLPGVNATVVNDFHNMLLPLLHLRIVQLTLDLRGSFESRLTAMTGLQVGIQSYNSQLAVWEPLVEDFDVHAAVHLKGGAICDFCMSDRHQISSAGTKLQCEGIPTCLFGATKTVVFAPAAARASETKHFIYQELLLHQAAQASAPAHSGTHEDDAKLVTTCLLVIKKAITVNVSRNGVNVLLQFLDLISRAGTNAEQDAAWRSRLGAFVYVDNQSGIPFLVAGHSGAAPPPTSADSFFSPSQLLPQSSSFLDESEDESVKLPTLSVGSEEGLLNYAAASSGSGMPRSSAADASSWINNQQLNAVMKDMMSKSTHWLSVADGERVATDIVAHEAPAGSVSSPLRRLMWMRPKSSSSSSKPIPVPIGYSNRSYLHLESRSGFKDTWHGESIICETVAEQGTLVMRLRGKVQLLNHLAFPVEVSYNDQRREVLAAGGRTPHFVPIQFLDGGDMTICPLLEEGRLQRSTHISIASLLRAPVATTKATGTTGLNGALEIRKVLTFYWDVHPDEERKEGDDGSFGVSRPPFQVILTASRKSEKHEALITISPPIRLENLVPFPLAFRTVCTKSERDLAWVHDNAASFSGTHGTVSSGHAAQICELEIFHSREKNGQGDVGQVPSAVALSVAIPGIGYRTYSAWSESSFVYGSSNLCSRIELIKTPEENDGDGLSSDLCPLHLRVEIVSTERLGTTVLNQLAPAICRIFAEYWLIDRTCLSIVMRTPDGRRVLPWAEGADRHAPVALFSGHSNAALATPKLKIGVRPAATSDPRAEIESMAFDISTVGLRGQITLRAGDQSGKQGALSMLPSLRASETATASASRRQFDIGVMIEQGPSIFSRTTVVTFVPRYYFINTSDRFQILIKQERDEDINAITLRPRQGCFFHWNDARLRNRVQLRFVCLNRQCTDAAFTEFYGDEEEKDEEECSTSHGVSEWSLPFQVTSVGNFVIRLHRAFAKASSLFSESCFLSEDAHAASLAATDTSSDNPPCEALSGMSLHVGVELHDPAFVVRFQEGRTFEASTEEDLSGLESGGIESSQVKDFVSFKLKNECTAFELFVWQKIPSNDTTGDADGRSNSSEFAFEGFDRVFPFQTIDFVPFSASVAPILHVQIQSVFHSSSTASLSTGDSGDGEEHSGLNASSSNGVAPARVVGSFEVSLDKLHRLPMIEIQNEGKGPKRLWVEVALEDATKTLRVTDVLPGASSEHKRRRRTALLRSWKRYNASVLWYSRVLFESHRHNAISAVSAQKEKEALATPEDQAKQRKQVRFANDVKHDKDSEESEGDDDDAGTELVDPSPATQSDPALLVALRVVDAAHLEDLYPPETNPSGVAPFVRVRMKGKREQEVAARTLRTQSVRAIFPRWVPAKIKKDNGSEILLQRFSLEARDRDDNLERTDNEEVCESAADGDPLCLELEVREGNKLLIFGSSLLGSATLSLRELVEAARGEAKPHLPLQPLRVHELLVPLVAASTSSVGVRSMVRIQLVAGSTLEDPTLTTTALEDAIRNFSVEAQLDRLVRCKSQLKVLLERESVDLALGEGTSANVAGASTGAAVPLATVHSPTRSSALTVERLESRLESSRTTTSSAPSVATDDSTSDTANDVMFDERVLSVVVMGVSNLQMAVSASDAGDCASGSAVTTAAADTERKVYCTVSYKQSTRAATSSVAKKCPLVEEPSRRPSQSLQGQGPSHSQPRFVRTHKFTKGHKLGLDLIYHSGRVVVQGVTFNGPCGKLMQDGEICIGDTIVAVNDKSIVNLHRDASFRSIELACSPSPAPGTFSLSFLRQPPSSFGHVAHAQDHKTMERYEAEWNRRVEFVETPQSAAESGEQTTNPKNKVLVRVYMRNELSDHGLTAAQESSVVPFLYFFGDEDTMDHLDHSKEDTRFDTLLGEAWVSVPTSPTLSQTDSILMTESEDQESSIASESLCALYAPTNTTTAGFSSTARAMVGQVRLALKWEHRNSYAQLKKQHQLQAYVQLEVHGLFVSIIDDGNGGGSVGAPRRAPREVMSISLSARHADTGIQVSYGLVSDGRHVVNTRIGHLQVDNQLLDTNYPVMVFPIRLDDAVQQDQSATTATSASGVPSVDSGGLGGRSKNNGTMPDGIKQPGSEGANALRGDRILLPTFQLMGVFSKRRTLVQFEYIFAQLQELDVELEDAVLVATAHALGGINWSLLGYGGEKQEQQQTQAEAAAIGDVALRLVDARWPFPNTPEFPLSMMHVEHRGGNTKVLLRWLLFCPIKMNVTFTSTTDRAQLLSLLSPEMSSVLRTLISAAAALVSNLDNAAIKVPEFYVENVLETTHTLGFYAMQHYVHHGLRSWYRIVGSVDFLGNPIGLVSALGTGVKDFFYTPAQMLLEDENGLRIENLRTGMTKGSKSLFRNTAVGIFHTTGKITETLGKGLALLAMDDEYNVERQRQTTRQKKKINDLGDAIAEGGKGFVGGVWDGVKGVVVAPVRGAERDGAGGFVMGIGQGVAGLFVKPAAGFLDMLTSLSRGAKSSAEAIDGGYEHGGLAVTRARLPRRICADGVLVSYSEREARGCAILALTSLDLTDDYVYHLDYGVDASSATRGLLLLTDKRVLCMSGRSGQKLWELALDSSLQVETNGAGLLTIAQSQTSNKVYKIECDDETAASNFKLAVSSARVELSATRYLLLNLEKKQEEATQHALLGAAHDGGGGTSGFDDDGRVDLSLLLGNLQDTLVTGLTDEELRAQPLRSVQVELCHLENKDAAASVPRRAVDRVLSFSVFQILVYGGPYQWTVYRRFSEFRELYAALHKTGGSSMVDALPPLPARTWLLPSTRSAVATQRQEALSAVLQTAIMHSSISGSHAMLEFLTRNAHEVRVSLPPLSPTTMTMGNHNLHKGSSGNGMGMIGTVGAASTSGINLRTP